MSKSFPTSLIMLAIFLSMVATMTTGWLLAMHYGNPGGEIALLRQPATTILVGPI